MNRLYLTEEGNVVPTLCEELASYRRVRKVLDLPSTASAGTLFILARSHSSASPPLRLSVNGAELVSDSGRGHGLVLTFGTARK